MGLARRVLRQQQFVGPAGIGSHADQLVCAGNCSTGPLITSQGVRHAALREFLACCLKAQRVLSSLVDQMLDEGHAAANVCNERGVCPLHFAAMQDDAAMVDELIWHGAGRSARPHFFSRVLILAHADMSLPCVVM